MSWLLYSKHNPVICCAIMSKVAFSFRSSKSLQQEMKLRQLEASFFQEYGRPPTPEERKFFMLSNEALRNDKAENQEEAQTQENTGISKRAKAS